MHILKESKKLLENIEHLQLIESAIGTYIGMPIALIGATTPFKLAHLLHLPYN